MDLVSQMIKYIGAGVGWRIGTLSFQKGTYVIYELVEGDSEQSMDNLVMSGGVFARSKGYDVLGEFKGRIINGSFLLYALVG